MLLNYLIDSIDTHKDKFVGVFVKPSFKEIEKYSKLNFDYFQIYGNYMERVLKNF